MTAQIISRRADTGLPDVRNHFRCTDGTYYGDGTTTTDMAGSMLAGEKPPPMPRLYGRALRHAFGE